MKEYAKGFYRSKTWRRTREAYVKSQNGLCERCKQAGDIVHHKKYITPRNIGNALVTLDWSNLELLCQDCHNKEHLKKQKTRYSVDERGNILPPYPKKITPAENRLPHRTQDSARARTRWGVKHEQ